MRIIGVGSAVPENAVTNAELESRLGLEPGWIERRTGIRKRPTAEATEATSDLATQAGAKALERSGIDPARIGLLLLATSTPDHLLPPTAPLVAHRLGLSRSGATDLTGACAGFLYALILASAYCQTSKQPVIIIAANILSRRLNPADAGTAALFSDGAGAVVIEPFEPSCLLGSHLASDGSAYDTIGIPAGGTRVPLTPQAVEEGLHLMTIRRGAILFKHAVNAMASSGQAAMRAAGIGPNGVDWWVPHQANVRITRETGGLLGIPSEKTISVVEECGNSSAATIPIAIDAASRSGRLRSGNIVLLTAAGAGLLSAAAVLRWK